MISWRIGVRSQVQDKSDVAVCTGKNPRNIQDYQERCLRIKRQLAELEEQLEEDFAAGQNARRQANSFSILCHTICVLR